MIRRRLLATTCLLAPLAAGCSSSGGAHATRPDVTGHEIAFSSDRAGTLDIWLVRADGSDPVQVTDDAVQELTPVWSPDGARLAYLASPTVDDPAGLYVMDADGAHQRRVADAGYVSGAPTWSPDGEQIVITSGDDDVKSVQVVDVAAGETEEIATLSGSWQLGWPDWSPDGELLVYSGTEAADGETTLWTMAPDGSDQTLLPTPGAEDPEEPSWSPDGTAVAFIAPTASHDLDIHDWDEALFVMSTDGTAARQLTFLAGNEHWPPAWSPDGRRIAVTADGEDQISRIVVVDVETGEVTELVGDPAYNSLFPSWR